jgi:hypothetical protein
MFEGPRGGFGIIYGVKSKKRLAAFGRLRARLSSQAFNRNVTVPNENPYTDTPLSNHAFVLKITSKGMNRPPDHEGPSTNSEADLFRGKGRLSFGYRDPPTYRVSFN